MKILNPIVYFALFCFVFLSACSKNESFAPSFDRGGEGKRSMGGVADESGQVANQAVADRRLVKEGSVGFKTDAVAEMSQKVRQMIERYKGFVSREDSYNYSGNSSFTLVARIPVNSFDKFIFELEKAAGSFESRSIGINDVTAQFVDTKARLNSKKEVEKSYLSILEKAKTIDETLAVQKMLGEIRGEIESLEGQLKLMEDSTAYSTLTISFYENHDLPQAFTGIAIIAAVILFILYRRSRKKKLEKKQ